jgi:Tol biopolymer transport system component
MKKMMLSFSLLILSISNLFPQQSDLPKLTGPYLGQKPPGMIPELFAPGVLSTGSQELDITFSLDGNEIFFTRSGPDWYSAILQFKREDGKWIGPIMPTFSGKYQNNYPFVSPDGNRLYFDSQEPLEQSNTNSINNYIFVSEFSDSGWSTGRPIEPGVVINKTESFVSVAENCNIYFGARYDDGLGGSDIYMCEYRGGNYTKPINLGKSINSEHNEFHSYIAPDESYLLFDARKPDGFSANDIYISFKLSSGQWSKAINLGKNINTEYIESRPYISSDGKYLFFSSNRLKIKRS